ncbi:MAG: ClpXP protease specificity-enhancing factor SspB [Pseudomonadota bacterium]
MKAQRPYLLRALYQWLLDSDEIPYVLIDAQVEGVQVPEEHIQDGQIVLNIGPSAVRDLVLEDQFVMCSSRFSGRQFELILPMTSVRAIYGKDSGQGMVFPEEAIYLTPPAQQEAGTSLRRVDQVEAQDAAETLGGADDAPPQSADEDDQAGDGRPNLKLV